MISDSNFKSVTIDITTYKKRFFGYCPNTMNEDSSFDGRYCKSNKNRFICSICLNRKTSHERTEDVECCKRKSRSCPKCQRQEDEENTINKSVCKNKQNKLNGKNIQTSEHEVTQGLTLLNEVLTVFQSKKQVDTKKEKSKTIILKDACIGTDGTVKNIHHLTISKLFRYSIENSQVNENGKFTIGSCHPETGKVSQYSLDLTKHKSSSIPQMKLDELKNSFKEKAKSKDAIEEVNRMFATVRKNNIEESCDLNRPVIRNGPRVLPVVKTQTTEHYKAPMQCKCCQTTNYQMSSGDSINKHGCCHKRGDKGNEYLYVCSHCHKDSYPNNCTVCEHCCHKDYKIQNVKP